VRGAKNKERTFPYDKKIRRILTQSHKVTEQHCPFCLRVLVRGAKNKERTFPYDKKTPYEFLTYLMSLLFVIAY